MVPVPGAEEAAPDGRMGGEGAAGELLDQEELWDGTTFFIEGVLLPVLAVFGIVGERDIRSMY
jgi:hypothetical protein